MPVFSNEYKINPGADIPYPAVEGAANQRVWTVSVPNNEMKRLGVWYFPEGAIGLLIQVSAITAGNSGTSQYLFQSGFTGAGSATEQGGSWYRLMPFNSGVGHGSDADTGDNKILMDANATNGGGEAGTYIRLTCLGDKITSANGPFGHWLVQGQVMCPTTSTGADLLQHV